MIIERLRKDHAEDAAKIVAENYKRECQRVPSLPAADFYAYFYDAISRMADSQYGVAAIRNRKLAGFLSGMPVNAHKGLHRGVYCDICAHGATGDKKDVYQRLYEQISEVWVKNGCLTHSISVFAHEEETVGTWFHLGFGNRGVDTMRPLTGVAGVKKHRYQIRRATERDAEGLLLLKSEERLYYSRAPLFMPAMRVMTMDDVKNDLTSNGRIHWLALDGEKPVAKMTTEKGGEYPFIANDEKTINVCSVYALEEARGMGLAADMLSTIVEWAKSEGYERLGVDYESFNRYGSRFWEKHFTPFAYSMFRRLDERILWANEARAGGIVI